MPRLGEVAVTPQRLLRIAIVVALVAAWWLLRRAGSPLARPGWEWLRLRPMIDVRILADIVGALLFIYLMTLLWWLYNPWRSRRADDAMAFGCIGFAAIAVALMLVALTVGWYLRSPWIIAPIAWVTLLFALQMLAGLIMEGYKAARKRIAAAREARPDQPE